MPSLNIYVLLDYLIEVEEAVIVMEKIVYTDTGRVGWGQKIWSNSLFIYCVAKDLNVNKVLYLIVCGGHLYVMEMDDPLTFMKAKIVLKVDEIELLNTTNLMAGNKRKSKVKIVYYSVR